MPEQKSTDDASTSPAYAKDRVFKSQLVKDDGQTYLVLTEREVVGKVNTWPGKPPRKKWDESRVTVTIDELRALAKKYLTP